MREGVKHEFPPQPNIPPRESDMGHLKWECLNCGEHFSIRSSAPSCRRPIFDKLDPLWDELASRLLDPTRAAALLAYSLDELVKRRWRWPKFRRDQMLPSYARYRTWRAQRQEAPANATASPT